MRNVPTQSDEYGKLVPCECLEKWRAAEKQAKIVRLSGLDGELQRWNFDTWESYLHEEETGIAIAYAQEPQGWLILNGRTNLGKTHLAVAIAKERLALGDSVLFQTVPDLLDHLKSTFRPSSEVDYDEVMEYAQQCDLLILDDLGAQSSTNWAEEKLYQIINHRYRKSLPMIVTSNLTMDELAAANPRVAGRLSSDLANQYTMPAQRGET